MNLDLESLRAWIGRDEESHEWIVPTPLHGLEALLDREAEAIPEGAPVPPGGHWLYFLPRVRASAVGPDGHAWRGGFLPPVPLPRRMWAGSQVEIARPLRVGDRARRISEIRDVTAKEGRSGQLVLVAVRHRITVGDALALTEDQDIVYREAPAPGATLPAGEPAPDDAAWRATWTPDTVTLFRYSALTFNGHRIHWDRPYAAQVEGYPGLVVHGPLVATLMLDLWRARHPAARLRGYSFRMIRPLFDGRPLTVAGKAGGEGTASLWTADDQGRLAATARAWFQ